LPDYDALIESGRRRRADKNFAEAEADFEAAAAVAEPGSRQFALARYFTGLTRQEDNDEAGAVTPLEEALRIFGTLPGEAQSAALIGVALGLCLLRTQRWASAASVLEQAADRFGNTPKDPRSLASCLHNLAMAETHSGDVQRGLETARRASALRAQLDGPDHPYTIETRIVEAYALVESGHLEEAGTLIRRSAQVILGGAGEAHPYFADALLAEARRLARLGDGVAAEALARRAVFLLKQLGYSQAAIDQREREGVALLGLWRAGSNARSPSDVALWRVSMQHTLRRYRVATLDFAPSGDRPAEEFFFVPATWPLSQARYVANVVLADANAVLNSQEPADANFVDVTQAVATAPGAEELRGMNFAEAFRSRRTWETSIAYNVVNGSRSFPLSPVDFGRALAARGVPDALLAPLGVDASALAAARSEPEATLRSVLMLA